MDEFKNRRAHIVAADRFREQGRQLRGRASSPDELVAAGRLLERAAKLYRTADLGETARLAWQEAAACHEAGSSHDHAERCERRAEAIPEYWTFRKEQAR